MAFLSQEFKNLQWYSMTTKKTPWGTLRKEGAPRWLLYLN